MSAVGIARGFNLAPRCILAEFDDPGPNPPRSAHDPFVLRRVACGRAASRLGHRRGRRPAARRDGRAHHRDPELRFACRCVRSQGRRNRGQTLQDNRRCGRGRATGSHHLRRGRHLRRADRPGREIFHACRRLPERQQLQSSRQREVRQQGRRQGRLVHPHRGPRPRKRAHRDRRFRDRRLFAGDFPRLLRVAALRRHQ